MAIIELEGENLQDFIVEVTRRLEERKKEKAILDDLLIKAQLRLANEELNISQLEAKILEKKGQIENNENILSDD